MFHIKAEAFKGYVRSYRADLKNSTDPFIVLTESESSIYKILKNEPNRFRFILCMCVVFEKFKDNEIIKKEFYFTSKAKRILSKYELNEKINETFQEILNHIEEFLNLGSGWIVDDIKCLDLHVGAYKSFSGGCLNVKLPNTLKNKKALLQIKCKDNLCFIYAVLAALYPQKHNKNLASTYKKYKKKLSFHFLKFPVKICEIAKFEKINKLKINIYGYDSLVFPIYRTSNNKYEYKEIDILLYQNHYYLITNFNRLLNEKRGLHKFCKNCLIGFARRSTLIDHEKRCLNNAPQKVSLPSGNQKFLKFKSFNKMVRHPFVVYADFESILKPIQSCEPSKNKSFSVETQTHIPACYSLILLDDEKNILYHKFYIGNDVIENFLCNLKNIEHLILKYMKRNIPFQKINACNLGNICHICGKNFSKLDLSVINHNHLNGNIYGKACQSCNLNYKLSFFVPIIMHNLKGYDSHFILEKVSGDLVKNIKLIPVNTEKCTAFSLDSLKFLDSFLFLPSSLSVLVENLKKNNYAFPIFNSFFSAKKCKNLLLRKGIFPYKYFSSFHILNRKELPPKNAFYNDLTDSSISHEEYDYANLVYKKFKCSSFKDYLQLYLETDVALLADVFENFRDLSTSYFDLDPVHFYTTPSLTWCAGLKFTNVCLELLTDYDMYLMLESGIRGGMCLVSKRYSKANNKYLSNYDKSQPSSYIMSMDVNNLYGATMVFNKLPESDFEWLTQEEISLFDINLVSEDSDTGYFLEVDLVYPPYLHNLHNSFPLAPSHEKVTKEMLSSYQKSILDKLGVKYNNNTTKLLNTFSAKKNYVIHYLNLKFYLKQGLKIEKIHRIIKFKQSYWLRSYIMFNSNKRKKSNNSFDRDYFKLMNNAFFGRTCMNIRKHVNVKIALNKQQCKKYLSDAGLEYFSILNESSVMFKTLKSNLFLNQPLYVGFSVLELSKLYMFQLYYDIFKPVYRDNVSLLYTDTDSLCLEFLTEDLYLDLKHNFKHIMDFSNYNQLNEYFSKKNESALGFLKDETSGVPIQEFCALRPKMYSYIFGDKNKKTAKGTKKCVIKNILKHEMYVNLLENVEILKQKQTGIISKKHKVATVLQNKTSLSCFYDKMYLKDSINCLAYGHENIKNEK